MKTSLTNEENEVLNEFINFAKHESGILTAAMFEKRLLYDFVHGKGEAIELLNKHLYEIINSNNLKDYQIRRLAKEVIHREHKWLVIKNLDFNFDDVIFDGVGYVVLSDGTRLDIDTEPYRLERETFNKIQSTRLASRPTNGKEFLQ